MLHLKKFLVLKTYLACFINLRPIRLKLSEAANLDKNVSNVKTSTTDSCHGVFKSFAANATYRSATQVNYCCSSGAAVNEGSAELPNCKHLPRGSWNYTVLNSLEICTLKDDENSNSNSNLIAEKENLLNDICDSEMKNEFEKYK